VALASNWEQLKPLARYIDLEGGAAAELERWRNEGEVSLSARLRYIDKRYGDKADSVWQSFWAARIRPRLQQRYTDLARNTAVAPPADRARLELELALLAGWLSRPMGL